MNLTAKRVLITGGGSGTGPRWRVPSPRRVQRW